MAFLDNSGDIILDAVLTDTGRYRLAKGDGSFKIVKFALGDDEINYALYNKNHPSGSAYYDLEILQTPVLEAFTNNTSTMNSKLLSIPRTNLLYLPVMKINNSAAGGNVHVANSHNSGFIVCVTDDTFTSAIAPGTVTNGFWNGQNPGANSNYIRVDQGINNSALSWRFQLDQDLKETQYIVEIDSRLGMITNFETTNQSVQNISFIDDDNIASYYFSLAANEPIVGDIWTTPGLYGDSVDPNSNILPVHWTIAGPQGTALRFKIQSTLEIITSDYLFTTIGNTFSDAATWGFDTSASKTYSYIDTNVKITGATTGYSLSIPVRFVKQNA
tara:strand:- start:2135 stop:3124 length:990 start_codon:yes stop_codon:yes gene_type:complete